MTHINLKLNKIFSFVTIMNIYGIPNCNTVKKAQDWLTDHGFTFVFHNFKKEGVTDEKLQRWCEKFGWENVLNKKGTTWRKLTAEQQQGITDQASAINILMENHSAIKRPVVEVNQEPLLIGFDEAKYQALLK